MVPAAEMITYSVRGAYLPNRPERKPKLMVRIRTRTFVTGSMASKSPKACPASVNIFANAPGPSSRKRSGTHRKTCS
jgi:hypothetical protein